MYKGHPLPRLRGAMVSPNIDAESLRVLGQEWHANLIRFQLIRSGRTGQPMVPESYDDWLEAELKKLDAALPLCEKYGLYVVVDLHSPPGGKATAGGYLGSDGGLFSDRQAQDKFVTVWRRIATRYRGAKAGKPATIGKRWQRGLPRPSARLTRHARSSLNLPPGAARRA